MKEMLTSPWASWTAAAVAALILLFWYVQYFFLMAPRRGTLEWIALADRRQFPAPEIQKIRGSGWAAVAVSALLGAGCCLLRMDRVYAASLPYAGLAALWAAAGCCLFLQFGGGPLSAACATALLLSAGAPLSELTAAIWLLLPAAAARRALLRLSAAALSFFLLFFRLDSGTGEAVLCLGAFLLCVLCACLRRPCSPWPVIGGAMGFLTLAAAMALGRIMASGVTEGSAILSALRAQLLQRPALPEKWNIPALLIGTAALPALILSFRQKAPELLAGSLMGLLCMSLAFFGMEEAAYLGCTLELSLTFSGTERRGGQPWILLVSAVLLASILITTGGNELW